MTFSGRPSSQRDYELARFVEILAEHKVHNYLEIGSRHGDSFHAVMSSLPPGSKGTAVDLPDGPWGRAGTEVVLKKCIESLKDKGYDVTCVLGNSTDDSVRREIISRGPYDAVFLDGDHRSEGVTKDWEFCKDLSPLVAFHDIDGEGIRSKDKGRPTVQVPTLWKSLKTNYMAEEIIDPRHPMGIGVVFLRQSEKPAV